MSMRRQVLSFLFFSSMSGLLSAMVLSVWMGMSHRIVTLSFSVTVLGSCSYHRSFTSMPSSLQILPVHVCSCLVVAVDMFSFSQFRAARDQVVNGLVEIATQSTFWIHVRLLEDVVLVPVCLKTLILGWMITPSDSALRLAAFSLLWALSWSTPACFTRCGYLPWNALIPT